MSTDLAIAAIKAQALWDAGDQLRKQAAELHPEFARRLGVHSMAARVADLFTPKTPTYCGATGTHSPMSVCGAEMPCDIHAEGD